MRTWNSGKGGQNVPVFVSTERRIVAFQEGMGNIAGSSNQGNYVKIVHGGNVFTLYAHLLKGSINSIDLKLGAVMIRGDCIGRMNNSGTGYRVDPFKSTRTLIPTKR